MCPFAYSWRDLCPFVFLAMATAFAMVLLPKLILKSPSVVQAQDNGAITTSHIQSEENLCCSQRRRLPNGIRNEWRLHRKQRRVPLKEAVMMPHTPGATIDSSFEFYVEMRKSGPIHPYPIKTVNRRIQCGDACDWLCTLDTSLPGHIITSIPDISEVGMPLEAYKSFFCECVELIVKKLMPRGIAIFYQSDAFVSGQYLDKSFLVQISSEKAGGHTLWHKIVLYNENALQKSHGRPPYSHMIAVSRGVRTDEAWVEAAATPSVLQRGEMTWARAMGSAACAIACGFVRAATLEEETLASKKAASKLEIENPGTRAAAVFENQCGGSDASSACSSLNDDHVMIPACVIDPFAGVGTALAVANEMGLDSFGVELSRKRCKAASTVRLLCIDDAPPSHRWASSSNTTS